MTNWPRTSRRQLNSILNAVFDTGPVIHLDELNCLDLLGDFREILLPDAVLQEIRQHRPSALKRSNLSFIRSPRKYPDDEALRTMCRIFSIDAGEANALALMEKNPKAIFFTDDASARLVAEQMRFKGLVLQRSHRVI